MRKRKRKQQKKNRRKKIIWYSVFLIVVLTGRFIISGRDDSMILTETKRNQIINSNEWKEIFEHSEDYPPVLLEDLKRNPELLDFVKKYPGEQTAQDVYKRQTGSSDAHRKQCTGVLAGNLCRKGGNRIDHQI